MDSQPQVVSGRIGVGLLAKADRLFRNDNDGVWIEILQNSRRAGATLVNITIEEPDEKSGACVVTVHDNGRGIEDFQNLLTLGSSAWDELTQQKEDPAGMGFFALCRSEVQVHSGLHSATIAPSVFLGRDRAMVQELSEPVRGTRIRFSRESTRSHLTEALKRTAEFYPVEVRLDGEPLERHDFLEGALYRETIDGIEVGFSTMFHWGRSYMDPNWNFYGARIRQAQLSFRGLLQPGRLEPETIYVRFNVLETARVKLQLPDRKGIIEDEFYREFLLKARAAAYRFFQTQERHALLFEHWKEAKGLGIILPEAAHLLRTWHAIPADDSEEPLFGTPELTLLPDNLNAVLVGESLDHQHTLEGALQCGALIEGRLFAEDLQFRGYTWYDSLPRIVEAEVLLDGIPYGDWNASDGRPKTIEVELTVTKPTLPDRQLRLPAFIHVDSDTPIWERDCFVAVERSPWDNPQLKGPFSVLDFLVKATFCSSDDAEADSWTTQRDHHEDDVRRQINEYFRGPKATLLALLRETLDRQASKLAAQLGVTQIRFIRVDNAHSWSVELVGPPEDGST